MRCPVCRRSFGNALAFTSHMRAHERAGQAKQVWSTDGRHTIRKWFPTTGNLRLPDTHDQPKENDQ